MTDFNVEQESDFDWLANFYASQGAINHPSELHGLLIGRLSGGERLNADEWLKLVVEHMGLEQLVQDEKSERALTNLVDLYSNNVQQLEDLAMGFSLVLPDDEFILNQRVEALGMWVRGFLEGLALSAQGQLQSADKDIQELLRDLVAISQIDDQAEDSEEGEKEINEIIEYVRIGVVTVFSEFNGEEAPEESQDKTLH
ncbi:UPF0149 family protein [Alkalimarinus sediminis]|uniref:UPF0149 family protein n=1 Tax=Alkalimarinus sediminis TaxID=1632866 RepID=A0A9E8HH55_9ALTE|nr:UPF0149 family protein [Alkalimarinus sediminis]UZW74334.1 UPF0149 family protein [Alkalimarinus sediminis]